MDRQIELSIIIVSWNVRELLQQALESLLRTNQQIIFEIVVVDNASVDHSAAMVRESFPQVRLIENKNNLGFAKACNQGAKIARGQYLLFLNDDSQVFDNTLNECVNFFKKRQNIGVLGCSIKNPDGTQQPSVRRFPTLRDQLVILLKMHNFFPKLIKKYMCSDFDYEKTQVVDQVMGAFFLTSRPVYNRVGGFDESYYFWFEEVDFCKQVIKCGLDVVYFSEARIIHYGGASFKQWRALPEQKLLNNSLKVYFRKHKSKCARMMINLFLPANLFLASLVEILEFFNANPKNKK